MLTQERCKEMLGDRYHFESMLSPQKIKELLSENNQNYAGTVAFELIAGCVKLETAVFVSDGNLAVGYECSVKDRTEDGEWIAYDVLPDTVNLGSQNQEQEMFLILDRYIAEQKLSYTECHHETIKPKKEPMENE